MADTRRKLTVPARVPLVMQDITIMRCTACGAIVPGAWKVSRKTMLAGVDHVLDEHRAALVEGSLRPPLFVNCAIQDPFWWDERGGDTSG
ncbi:hypothetical protein AB0392_50545 [Nonomuraea angiospora]|uniref:hypothetical protein n=1 Tax=Nonomuraea angiospora TaxID=46172 RepID=UPI00344C966A